MPGAQEREDVLDALRENRVGNLPVGQCAGQLQCADHHREDAERLDACRLRIVRRQASVLGFLPAPYGALYAASKHAVEGYSESVDHEVREHGVRVLLVEPAYTSTGFDANVVQPDTPLPVYAQQRHIAGQVVAAGLKDGDDPATVAKVIVVAATDPKPKLRYTAGPAAGRVSTLRRIIPARAFDRQIRKLNRLAG